MYVDDSMPLRVVAVRPKNINLKLDQAISEAEHGKVEVFDSFDEWAASLDKKN
jgi:hypothetical protein